LIWLYVDERCNIYIGYIQVHERTDVWWDPKA